MNRPFSRLAPALALAWPLLASAQSGTASPAQSQAPAPALRYESAFDDYKPWQDIKPGDWRRLNDNVKPPAAAGGNAAPSPAAPAAGHQMHGGKP